MINLVEARDNNKKEWNNYCSSSSGAHLYHDYRWKKVLEEGLGHDCYYIMAREDQKVTGLFPLAFIKSRIIKSALISVPFVNYGGVAADSKEIITLLLKRAVEILNNSGGSYLEIRSFEKYDFSPLKSRDHKVTAILSLSESVEAQWNGLDGKVRNQIRKAQKSGLSISEGEGDLFNQFYKVYSRNMRDLGTPVIPKSYFKSILRYFPEESRIFIVMGKNKAVAAAFTLSHKGKIEMPWASSIRRFNKMCPNEYMYWEVIKYAISQGLKQFDFGRCTKDTGTYKFKKQWNPEIKQLHWLYWTPDESNLPSENPNEGKFKHLIAIWKKLPIFITNAVGPYAARQIPTF